MMARQAIGAYLKTAPYR